MAMNFPLAYWGPTDIPVFDFSWAAASSPGSNGTSAVVWNPDDSLYVRIGYYFGTCYIYTSTDGDIWTARTPATAAISATAPRIAWSPLLSLFATATGLQVQTSPDGITWTNRTPSNGNVWYGMCWSPDNEIFVSVSTNGTLDRVMTSPDGATWTTRTTPNNDDRQSVTYGNGIFVSPSHSGGKSVIKSTNGVTWTAHYLATTNNYFWYEIAYSPYLTLFALPGTFANNLMHTSPDGENWTQRSVAFGCNFYGICWAHSFGQFVAVANDGTSYNNAVSPDGITWSASDMLNGSSWYGVAHSPALNQVVAVGGASPWVAKANPA